MRICWKTTLATTILGASFVLHAVAQSDSISPVPLAPAPTEIVVSATPETKVVSEASASTITVRVWDVSFARSRPLRKALMNRLACDRVDVVRYRNRCLEFQIWTAATAGLLAEDIQGTEVSGGWLRVKRVEADVVDCTVYLRPWHDPRR